MSMVYLRNRKKTTGEAGAQGRTKVWSEKKSKQ